MYIHSAYQKIKTESSRMVNYFKKGIGFLKLVI